jgi:type IV pilus assembly protein PilF
MGILALTAFGTGCGGASGDANAPNRSVAEYDVARDAFHKGRLREALEHVQQAMEFDDDNADAAYLGSVIMLAFCAADEQSSDCRFDEAEGYARRALDADENMRDAKNTLGVILIHQARYDEAIAVLKPLANDILYGSPEKAWGNLGWAYLERGSHDEAIDALRRSVAAQPLFCVGQYRLGLAYEKKGELSAAFDAYTRALEVDRPECQRLQEAYEARARVAEKRGMQAEARADLERCREIAATTPTGRGCAARLETLQ